MSFFRRKARAPSYSAPAPARPDDWAIQYSPGCPGSARMGEAITIPQPGRPLPVPDGTRWDQGADSLHYLTRGPLALPAGRLLVARVHLQVPTGVVITPTQGGGPAKMRLYIQRSGDNMSGAGVYEHYRWWSKHFLELTEPGEHMLSVKIDPSYWLNVRGQPGEQFAVAFDEARGNVGRVGGTFGGVFAGHGVSSVGDGTASVAMVGFEVV